ncbi:MAG: MFS transporter [Nannocystaceae bacterium]
MPSLLRRGSFRRLWIADTISMFGDWFTYVAVGLLALTEGEGLLAVAVVLVAHTLPRAALAPLAGRLADRVDRRAILVVVSLGRAAAVLGMVAGAVDGALWIVQALLLLRMALGAFTEPAASAALPQLVALEELGPANALISVTWSVVFAVGVALGGVATAWIGPVGALLVDAATFVVAALLFSTLPRLAPVARDEGSGESAAEVAPARAAADVTDALAAASPEEAASVRVGERVAEAAAGLGAGWRYALGERAVLQAALAKLPPALAGGCGWVLLHALVGSGRDAAFLLGALHCTRAVGTGVGPLIWIRVRALARTAAGMHAGTGLTLAAVFLFSWTGNHVLLVVTSLLWGAGLGANWVTATTRVQTLTPDRLRGRVAAIELMSHTVGACLGGVIAALCVDGLEARWIAGGIGIALAGLAWGSIELAARSRRASGVGPSPA